MADKDEKIIIGDGTEVEDINKNVGSFSSNVVPAITKPDPKPQPTKEVKTTEVQDEPKLNFEKFNKTKKRHFRPAHSKFGILVEKWLANPKSLWAIWGVEFLIFAALYAIQIALIVELNTAMHSANTVMNLSWVHMNAQAGFIMSCIGIVLPTLPILFLITSWFIGINGVHASKVFHMTLWIIFAVCIALLIADCICGFYALSQYWTFTPMQPAS